MAQTIVGDAVPPRERGRYQGYFGAVFATATVVGPVLGGFIAEHLHWTLIFWINVPLGILAFAISARALKALPRYERPHKLDFLGAALMVSATVALLFALNWGGMRYPWGSPQILGLAGAAAILFVLFAWRVSRAPEPFLPLEILRNRVVAVAVGAAALAYGTMIGLSIFTPIYFEIVLGQSASGAGLTLIPFMGGVVVGATAGGRMMAWLVHYKRISVVGLPFAFAALLPLAIAPASLSIVAVGALLLVTGTGIGTVLPISTVSVQNAVLPYQLGTATGLANFMRALASALMVALYGAILFGGVSGRGVTLETIAANAALASAAQFRWIFAVAAACLFVSWLFMLVMEERPLRVAAPAKDAAAVPAE
jgi:MFS family permease